MAILSRRSTGKVAAVVISGILMSMAVSAFAQSGGPQAATPPPQRAQLAADPFSGQQGTAGDVLQLRNVQWDPASASGEKDMIIFTFRVATSTLVRDFRDNGAAFKKLNDLLSDRDLAGRVDHIIIAGSASPEGRTDFNQRLSMQRATAVRNYIMSTFSTISPSRISTLSLGENWIGLRKMVGNDNRIPFRDEVIGILDGSMSDNAKLAALKTLRGGAAYRYMLANTFPDLRSAVVCIVFYKEQPAPAPQPAPMPAPEPAPQPAPAPAPVPIPAPAPEVAPEPAPLAPTPAPAPENAGPRTTISYEKVYKPLFAIKTNLLFDAVTAVNLEVEVPIGQRFSIAGEWTFPWWLWSNHPFKVAIVPDATQSSWKWAAKPYAFQLLQGTIEPRYWFGDRTGRPVMTGWFAGIHGGGGYYDLQGGNKGYQGEFWVAGISGGYAHTISRSGNWRMEYSLGLGYMRTRYRLYYPKLDIDNNWYLYRQLDGHYTWIGPTRAKVSLVYMFHYNQRSEIKTTEGGAQ